MVRCFLVMLWLAAAALAAPAANKAYDCVEVMKFGIESGVDLPPDYHVGLTEALVKRLEGMKKFKSVLRQGEDAGACSAAIRVAGTVTEYKAGSRAKRYLVGMGAGATKIVAQMKVDDRASGAPLLEKKVDGKVIMGVMGGDSAGAMEGLAKEVVSVLKERLFKK